MKSLESHLEVSQLEGQLVVILQLSFNLFSQLVVICKSSNSVSQLLQSFFVVMVNFFVVSQLKVKVNLYVVTCKQSFATNLKLSQLVGICSQFVVSQSFQVLTVIMWSFVVNQFSPVNLVRSVNDMWSFCRSGSNLGYQSVKHLWSINLVQSANFQLTLVICSQSV